MNFKSPKHYINLHPERKEYEGVAMNQKVHKLMIKDMDFYDTAEITNAHWSTHSYNLFLRNSSDSKSSIDFQKFWFIPRPPNGKELFEDEKGYPYDEN